MLGYIIVICCMTAWYFLCKQFKDKNHKTFLLGCAILMTLFYGLRGPYVGSDTLSYIYMFTEDGNVPITELWNYMWKEKSPAFVLAEWIFYQFLPYYQLWLIATSAFFFFTFSKFVEKNSSDPFFSYFIFFAIFGTFQMTGIRQSCAMAILMLAFEQMKKKKLVNYLLLIVLAYLFHKSAIAFLPLYFIANRRITKFDIPVVAVLVVLIYQNRAFLFDFIKDFTSYDYFDQLNHAEPINFSIMIYAATLAALLLCLLLTRQKKREFSEKYREEIRLQSLNNYAFMENDKIRKFVPSNLLRKELRKDVELTLYSQYANAMILASFFMPLVAINGAVRRVVMYFALFMIFLIPKAFEKFLEPQSRKIAKLLLCAFLLYLLKDIGSSSYAYSLFF